MTKPQIQIGDQVREMTDAEYAQWQLDVEAHAAKIAANTVQENARQSALAKLADLGLTETEIEALVG